MVRDMAALSLKGIVRQTVTPPAGVVYMLI
jgi:hypothetical protein